MKQVCKLLRLNDRERNLLINTFILLGLVRLGLCLLPFQKLQQRLAIISQQSPQRDQISLNQIIWAVNASTRYMPGGAKCLARALTCQTLMNRYGYSPQLRIGVTKSEKGKLEAHAWIENQGQIVIGNLTDLSRFTPLPSLYN
ncbi:lasso peptide biosynthesis B2 protein [Chlorogloeopsis sp. ULAP02]|uniref:lasso peptide biosynthesis B2 protein n=1 Tax=Chlorogloeopsis sp. ULAP02 TaxID=3107926 RepID=UPI0031348575